MDQINSMQLNIDKNKTKAQEKTFKQHLKCLKENDKKAHKMKKKHGELPLKFEHNNVPCVITN
jgi:hypothetical protein